MTTRTISDRKRSCPKAGVMIFADASWCAKTRVGGWGAWLKVDGGGSVQIGGPLKGEINSANTAEAMALANAVHEARRRGMITHGAVVMLQSDCLNMLMQMRRRIPEAISNQAPSGHHVGLTSIHKPAPAGVMPPLDVIARIASELHLSIQVRHVAGHRAGGGRQWVNRACDAIAKDAMRARRSAVAQPESTNA